MSTNFHSSRVRKPLRFFGEAFLFGTWHLALGTGHWALGTGHWALGGESAQACRSDVSDDIITPDTVRYLKYQHANAWEKAARHVRPTSLIPPFSNHNFFLLFLLFLFAANSPLFCALLCPFAAKNPVPTFLDLVVKNPSDHSTQESARTVSYCVVRCGIIGIVCTDGLALIVLRSNGMPFPLLRWRNW